jgi:hypothetical protein
VTIRVEKRKLYAVLDIRIRIRLLMFLGPPDPDPHVFGPPGSESISKIRCIDPDPFLFQKGVDGFK